MIGRCVGGHWPPLRLGNVQMVDKRCAEVVAPYGNICYQLKPVGAGRNNVKTICATQVCRACVE